MCGGLYSVVLHCAHGVILYPVSRGRLRAVVRGRVAQLTMWRWWWHICPCDPIQAQAQAGKAGKARAPVQQEDDTDVDAGKSGERQDTYSGVARRLLPVMRALHLCCPVKCETLFGQLCAFWGLGFTSASYSRICLHLVCRTQVAKQCRTHRTQFCCQKCSSCGTFRRCTILSLIRCPASCR